MKNFVSDGSVEICMADSKLAQELFFEIKIENPLPEIRRQYAGFLRLWIANEYCTINPEINLFFNAPPPEIVEFVMSVGCGRSGKKFVINREELRCPENLIMEIMKAFRTAEWLWEEYRERYRCRKIRKFEELLFPRNLHLVFSNKGK